MRLKEYLPDRGISYFLFGISVIVFLIFIGFALHAMYKGYSHVYNVTREIPWGLLISGYVFFVVISTGITIVSSIGHVFGVTSLIPIAKRSVYLAGITLIAGFMVIFFDLENPFRMAIWNVFSPNLTSNIWWMGTLYGVGLLFLIGEFFFLLSNHHKRAVIFGFCSLVSKIAAISNLGAVFGTLYSKEFWYGPYIPTYLIASAVASGCTAIIFFTYLGYKIAGKEFDNPIEIALSVVGKIWMLILAVLVLFVFWNIITRLTGSEANVLATKELVFGKYSADFWFFEIFLSLLIPFFLLLISRFRNINLMFLASILSFIGIFMTRFNMLRIGQIISPYFLYNVTDYPLILFYTPSFHEIMIVVGAMAFTMITFILGEGVFKGHKTEIH